MSKSAFPEGGFDNDAIREIRDSFTAMTVINSDRRKTIRNLKVILALDVVVAVMLVAILAMRFGLLW